MAIYAGENIVDSVIVYGAAEEAAKAKTEAEVTFS